MARQTRHRRHPKRHHRTLRKRMTSIGRMMPSVDIRNKGSLAELMKRIKRGPLTIVLVYADWCGHCTDFKPHFNAAAKSKNRTVQVASVNETMVKPMNDAIRSYNGNASSVNVTGYPTVLLMDNKGNQVANIDAVKDTSVMTEVMNKSGTLAAQSVSAPVSKSVSVSLKKVENIPKNSKAPSNVSMNLNVNERSKNINIPDLNANTSIVAIPEVANSAEKLNELESSIVSPPMNNSDLFQSTSVTNSVNSKKTSGGSLFSALASSVYHFAPAGVLLGIAGMTLRKTRRSKKHHRRSTHKRR